MSTQHNELIVPEAWKSFLPALDKITTFLDNEEDTLKQQDKHMSIFPPREQIFRALDCVGTPQNVKVVLLGQDPYIHPEQATGLAFGISNKGQSSTLQKLFSTHPPLRKRIEALENADIYPVTQQQSN